MEGQTDGWMGGYVFFFFLAETSKLFLVQFCPQDCVIWLYSSKLLLAVLFLKKKHILGF